MFKLQVAQVAERSQFVPLSLVSDPASLAGPLKGKDAVYIITPGTEKRGEIAMGAVDACKAAKVPFVVVVSVLNALDSSTIFGRQFQVKIDRERWAAIPKVAGQRSYNTLSFSLFFLLFDLASGKARPAVWPELLPAAPARLLGQPVGQRRNHQGEQN